MNWKMIAAIAVVALVAGCASLGELVGESDQAVSAAFAKIDTERAYWNGELDKAIDAGDADRIANVQQQLSDLNSAESAMYRVEDAVGDYINEDGTVNEGKAIREVSALLPFPANIIASIGIPLGLLGWREAQNRRVIRERTKIASEIVGSIDAMREESAELTDAMAHTDVKRAAWSSMSDKTWQFIDSQRNT